MANRIFETVEAIEEAPTEALRSYWKSPDKLARLTGYHWWMDGLADIMRRNPYKSIIATIPVSVQHTHVREP